MKKITTGLFILFTLGLISSCGGGSRGHIKVNGIQSKVIKVHSGNELELQNGLKVKLLGIKGTEDTKNYLEKHVQGKTVKIIRDSKQKEFIKSYKTKISAYVKVKGDRQCISGKLLLDKTAKLNQVSLKDSLNSFVTYSKDKERRMMDWPELKTYMLPATFQIFCSDNTCGTGFFIGEDGLALTNNHVWDGSKQAIIYFFGENGTLDQTNSRTINNLVMTHSGEKVDFTIFYVNLRPGEKVRYMPLVNRHINDGEELAKLGCPLGQPADFDNGLLKNYTDEGYLKHSINTNHGDSGGPIVNKYGEVIGINQSIDFNPKINEQAKGIAYAVDALLIRQILDDRGIKYGR